MSTKGGGPAASSELIDPEEVSAKAGPGAGAAAKHLLLARPRVWPSPPPSRGPAALATTFARSIFLYALCIKIAIGWWWWC
jgi:hypothetical protein